MYVAIMVVGVDGGEGGSSCPEWRQRQEGLLRYNCADSLDRTNAASYFIAVQVRSNQAIS